MHSIQWGFRIRALALTWVAIAALGEITAAQVQTVPATAANQSAGFCGGSPLCFEGANFAATITEFRTSEQGGLKIIDALVHFQNKTNQPLILGYVDGSASAIDDRGNRFALSPYGGNGVRGMGVISGNSMDPKFMLPAGGASDARFELLERLGQLQGVTYETELSIREINRIEGGQFVLGGETLMHYQGTSQRNGRRCCAVLNSRTNAAHFVCCGSKSMRVDRWNGRLIHGHSEQHCGSHKFRHSTEHSVQRHQSSLKRDQHTLQPGIAVRAEEGGRASRK